MGSPENIGSQSFIGFEGPRGWNDRSISCSVMVAYRPQPGTQPELVGFVDGAAHSMDGWISMQLVIFFFVLV